MQVASADRGQRWEPARAGEFHAYLERLLALPAFASSRRRAQLLRYLADHTLAGKPGSITEYGIGLDVFGKPESFDPRLEATVRVEMSRLRRALMEYYERAGSADPWRIEFAPRSYVPMIRPAERAHGSPAEEPSVSAPDSSLRVANRHRRWWIAASVLIAVTLAVILLAPYRTPPGAIHSIAILPLANSSGDSSQDSLADGITEELTSHLAGIQGLQVASHTSVLPYRRTAKPFTQITRELQVDALMEGSALRSGNNLHVTAQLIRTSTGVHVWAGSYDLALNDRLESEKRVAGAITRDAAVWLDPKLQARSRNANPEAYEFYLKGRVHWNRREVFEARDCFSQAIQKDPGYALAYTGLADANSLIAMDDSKPAGPLDKAQAAAAKALELDDRLPEAHTSMAAVKILRDWDWAAAETEFKRALALDPLHAPAHHWYATLYLAPLGYLHEAGTECGSAAQIDPLSLIYATDGGALSYMARRYDRAVEVYKRVLTADPKFEPARFRLHQVYEKMGLFQEAVAFDAETGKTVFGDAGDAAAEQRIYATAGYPGVVDWRIRKTLRGHWDHNDQAYALAVLYAKQGSAAQAMSELQSSVARHDPPLIFLKVDPVFDALRPDPAFQALERRVGLLQ